MIPRPDQILECRFVPQLTHPADVLGIHAVIASTNERLERKPTVSEILESTDVLRVHAVVAGSNEIGGRKVGQTLCAQLANELW